MMRTRWVRGNYTVSTLFALAGLALALVASALVMLLVMTTTVACGDDEAGTVSTVTAAVSSSSTTPGGVTPSTRVDTGVPEVVTFTTKDGVTLSGTLFGSGTRGVVLAHMYPADQTSWHTIAADLAADGYLVLTFDFRGYGASEGEKEIDQIDKDVSAAFSRIAQAGATQIVLVGASMGGTASLMAAVDLQTLSAVRLAGVVTLSSPVEFKGLSAAEAVAALGVPMLFIAAEDDVGADNARALLDLAKSSGLLIVAGDEHGTELFAGPDSAKVRDALWQFLSQNMAANR